MTTKEAFNIPVLRMDKIAFINAEKVKEALDNNTTRLKNLLMEFSEAYERLVEKVENRDKTELNQLKEALEIQKSQILEQISQSSSLNQQVVDILQKMSAYIDRQEAAAEQERAALEKLVAVLSKYG